jgi:hypothetical protein
MKTLTFAMLVWFCSPFALAARLDQDAAKRSSTSHMPSQKSVLLRVDIASGAVTAVADMQALDNVVDMNPSHALAGPYAVIVMGNGTSFITPAPTMKRTSELLVLVPFSVAWDVQTVIVNKLPATMRSFAIDGDLLLSKTDIAAANASPALKPHQFHPRAEWCFEPSDSSENKFAVQGGGSVCVTCISCADGSWEICGNFYSC